MELKQEESSTVESRPMCSTAVVRPEPNASANETNREDVAETLIERLTVRGMNMDVDDENVERHHEDVKRRSEKCCRRKTRENTVQMKSRRFSTLDMTTSRSCRHGLCVSFVLWTSVLLLFLTTGVVSSASDDNPRFDRGYPKYDHDAEVQGYISPEAQNTYNVIQFIRELMQMQRHQQQQQHHRANQQQQLQMYNNGEDLTENQIEWEKEKVPLPLLYQIRAMINNSSKEEEKRGSYMALCHFKICNLGKRKDMRM